MKITIASIFIIVGVGLSGCGQSAPNSDPKPSDPANAPVLKQLKAAGDGDQKSVMKQD
jgi:uncharacterized protein YceK